ncbi:DUF2336 domain-containing protein [Roseibium sp.]|uniref:DUF2336 domain-containing protein n=1 Tax=Roseibium sp. TaxID=1936156 RepID=UPI003D12219A
MTELAKLADLAKDSSTAGRKSLIATLTEMFLAAGDARGENTAYLFGDIALKLLGDLEEDSRADLAQRVSKDDFAPHQLMLELAKDTLAVAAPVLENSPVINSEDLIEIASSASMDHLEAIAVRVPIEEAVTTVLVDRGDAGVLSKVAGNEGAEINDTSFMTLVDKAGRDEAVQAALIGRPDLPLEVGKVLLPLLSEELQKQVLALGKDNHLAQMLTQASKERKKSQLETIERAKLQVNALVKDIKSGRQMVDEAVRKFAKAGEATELALLLAGLSDLPPAAVSQLLFSANDKPLVILCKALNVRAEAYKDLLMMRAQRLNIGGMELNDAIQRFGLMSVDGAKRSLEVLRQSTEPAAPKPEPAAKPTPAKPPKKVPFAAHR